MKWYGKIGYALTEDNDDGIWTPSMTWKEYYGDVQRFLERLMVDKMLMMTSTLVIL